MNKTSLESVVSSDDHVQLVYRRHQVDFEELQRLVTAENGCCGPAGIAFTMTSTDDHVCVSLKMIKEGVPARAVVSAFSEMKPST